MPFAKTVVVGAIATLLSASSAYADSIFITCGASSGYTYYMEGAAAGAALGWQKDGVNSKLQLLIKDNGDVDLISSGAPNNFYYSDDGCEFSRPSLPFGKNELVIVATCLTCSP